jgi:hypothetical protein
MSSLLNIEVDEGAFQQAQQEHRRLVEEYQRATEQQEKSRADNPEVLLLPIENPPPLDDLYWRILIQRRADTPVSEDTPVMTQALITHMVNTTRSSEQKRDEAFQAMRKMIEDQQLFMQNAVQNNQQSAVLPKRRYPAATIIDWSELPRINFMFPETIYPYIHGFDNLMRKHQVDDQDALTNLLGLHRSADNCRDRVLEDVVDDDYIKTKNNILKKRGYLEPIACLSAELISKIPTVRNAYAWIQLVQKYNTYFRMARAAFEQEYDQHTKIIEVCNFIYGFPQTTRHRLYEQARKKSNVPNILDEMLSTAPINEWRDNMMDNNNLTSLDTNIAAAGIFHNNNTNRNRTKPRNQQFPRLQPRNQLNKNNNFVTGLKRVDVPTTPPTPSTTPCRHCGRLVKCTRMTCTARGKICTKCGNKNHFASVCRKNVQQADMPTDTPTANNNSK